MQSKTWKYILLQGRAPELNWNLSGRNPLNFYGVLFGDKSDHSISQKHFKRKRILNQYKTWFFQRGSCVKATCKKTWNPKFPQSVLDIFSSSKYEVISSLNSTCSCLYAYFSRRLPGTIWSLDQERSKRNTENRGKEIKKCDLFL